MYIPGPTISNEHQIIWPEFFDKEDVFPYACGICGSNSLVDDKKATIRLKKTLLEFVVNQGIRRFYVAIPNRMGRFAASYLNSLKELYPDLSVCMVTTKRRRNDAEQEQAETDFYSGIELAHETEETGYGFNTSVIRYMIKKSSHVIYYEGAFMPKITDALESLVISQKLRIVHLGSYSGQKTSSFIDAKGFL